VATVLVAAAVGAAFSPERVLENGPVRSQSSPMATKAPRASNIKNLLFITNKKLFHFFGHRASEVLADGHHQREHTFERVIC
jgi:hypothetical protein